MSSVRGFPPGDHKKDHISIVVGSGLVSWVTGSGARAAVCCSNMLLVKRGNYYLVASTVTVK